jgi:hypothetical protein
LFAGGADGALFVPGAPGTLFRDVAGTQPVTAPGQAVALMRDLSGCGRHATQPTTAARPVWGRHPESGPRNILPANTADLAGGEGWSGVRSNVVAAATSATGEQAFDIIASTSDVNGAYRSAALISLLPGIYTMSAVVKGASFLALRPTVGTAFADAAQAWFDLGAGNVGTVALASGAAAFAGTPSATMAPVGDGAYRCTLTFTLAAGAAISPRFYLVDGNSGLPVTAGASLRIEAPQLEAGSAATAHQRRVSTFDITEPGQRAVHYLSADGVDDWMELALPFAPSGSYTLAAARQWLTGWPGPLTFGSVSGASQLNLAQGISLHADTSANLAGFPAAGGWPVTPSGRVDIVRVANAADAQAWRNGTPYPAAPSITGNPAVLAGFDTLFRAGGSFGSGRFYGGVMIDGAIGGAERMLLQREFAHKGGIVL